ncbi:DUF1772 domain-containing protein [Plantactinospora sp. GCM10030261]|uniref:anthrone oxygenase family protein n=1 Tax=Plantactinospora sp. GCM10030261 TaxID=3273420 RepID=UPI0036242513
MTDLLRVAALAASTLTTGLVAGLFYAFSCSVMLGLAGASDRTFVETMRLINRRIINGWFLTAFVGSIPLLLLTVALHLPAGSREPLPWSVAALALYLATIVITGRVNVPLNNQLDAAGPVDETDPAPVRARFEARWVRWNLVRTVTSVAAFGCLIGALLAGQ